METIIDISNLNYKCFKNFDLEINKGTYLTILGASKSGKTILSKLMCKIKANENVKILNNKKIVCVYSPEETPFLSKKVYDELKLSALHSNNIKNTINNIIKEFDVEYIIDKNISDLKYFEKQILIIICALLMNPDVLIFDDSITNITPFYRIKVLEILRKINKTKKITIINLTSDSEQIIYGKEIAIINNGDLVIKNKSKKILKDEKVLLNNGFKLPFIVELCNKLKYYDLVSDIVLKKEKLVEKIWN